MKLALACASLLIIKSVGTLTVRAINASIDGVMWLIDGGRR